MPFDSSSNPASQSLVVVVEVLFVLNERLQESAGLGGRETCFVLLTSLVLLEYSLYRISCTQRRRGGTGKGWRRVKGRGFDGALFGLPIFEHPFLEPNCRYRSRQKKGDRTIIK